MKKPPSNEQLKIYLDYLDKEMTIMGILSTFCIIALGVVAEKLLYPSQDSVFKFWEKTPLYCEAGLGGLLFAGLSFYRQRSLLAWYYGQLSLYQAKEDGEQVNELLTDSDAQYNWRWYQAGFGFLALAFLELGLAATSSYVPSLVRHEVLLGSVALVQTAAVWSYIVYAYSKYPEAETPFLSLWRRIFRRTK